MRCTGCAARLPQELLDSLEETGNATQASQPPSRIFSSSPSMAKVVTATTEIVLRAPTCFTHFSTSRLSDAGGGDS